MKVFVVLEMKMVNDCKKKNLSARPILPLDEFG